MERPASMAMAACACMLIVSSSILSSTSRADDPPPLFSQTGSDVAFRELIRQGQLPTGRNSTAGVTGSRIQINYQALNLGAHAQRGVPKDIHLHTLGNSHIRRGDFPRWSRWYQEDGSSQVFRLFSGEENVRNSRKLAARVETYSKTSWQKGDWHSWIGVYTIVRPHGAAIFQAKNNVNDWSLMLNMNDAGDIILNHRRGEDVTIAQKMTGTPFMIGVRDNGHDYEVYLNGQKTGAGAYARPDGQTTFRWGMYVGANPVRHDAMIFVTGAAVDPSQP